MHMKTTIYFLVATALVACSKQEVAPSQVNLQQNSGVKVVKQYEEYATTPGQSNYQFFERISIDYNDDATPVKVTLFGNYVNPDPATFRTYGYEYEYDNNKNIVKSFVFADGLSGKALDGVYTYNSKNQITSATLYQFNSTSILYKDTWTYPSPGLKVLSREDGNCNHLITYEFYFDFTGNCIKQRALSTQVDVTYYMSYDEKPSPGKGVFYDFMNDHGGQSWVLNTRNNWTMESTFNTLSKITYDSEGYPTVVIVDMVGRKRVYTYTTLPVINQ